MIWFFLAGFISGIVCWHGFVAYRGRRLEQRNRINELGGKKEE